jgi:hypothetical protein
MDLVVGQKVFVQIGSLRGTLNRLGTWNLPISMLPDGTVATILEVGRDYALLEECKNWQYPLALLRPYNKKLRLLKAIKDFT